MDPATSTVRLGYKVKVFGIPRDRLVLTRLEVIYFVNRAYLARRFGAPAIDIVAVNRLGGLQTWREGSARVSQRLRGIKVRTSPCEQGGKSSGVSSLAPLSPLMKFWPIFIQPFS